MILKASQRGGGKQLALHLLNTTDNEHMELYQLRGFISEDLIGAMKETYAISKGTQCKQFLFSVSLSPPKTENVPVEIFEDAINRIEAENGLTGQPRVIVFHEKEGRRHAHAVWSRIDCGTMTARELPFFKLKLRDISRELYLENDWKMPSGLVDSKAKNPKNYTLAEHQQAKRIGRNAGELKGTLQDCWAISDSPQAFAAALDEKGLKLAQGRRGHVAVTYGGEILSVARYVGKKAKDVRAKLGETDNQPSVEQAKEQIAKEMVPTIKRHLVEVQAQQNQRTTSIENKRKALNAHHQQERALLDQKQQERWQTESKIRSKRLNSGLKGLWDQVTGQRAKSERQNKMEAMKALKRDREQRQRLVEVQLSERQYLQREIKSLRTRHTREITDLYRDLARYRTLEMDASRSIHSAEFNRAANPVVNRSKRLSPNTGRKIKQHRKQKAYTKPRGPNPEYDL